MKGFTAEEIMNKVLAGQTVNVKYVRLDNEFRYGIADGPLEHRDLVEENSPVSAGFITLCKGFFMLHPIPSTSLGIGPLPEDEVLLKSIFKV